MIQCLQNVYRAEPTNVSILFRILNVFKERSVVDFTFLKRFYAEELPKIAPLGAKRTFVRLFLKFYNGNPDFIWRDNLFTRSAAGVAFTTFGSTSSSSNLKKKLLTY